MTTQPDYMKAKAQGLKYSLEEPMTQDKSQMTKKHAPRVWIDVDGGIHADNPEIFNLLGEWYVPESTLQAAVAEAYLKCARLTNHVGSLEELRKSLEASGRGEE